MRFYTIFMETENIHLVKDVGMIPECLAQYCENIDSFLVTYKNGEYPYWGSQVKRIKLIFLKRALGKCIDGVLFILKNRKMIDVLNIYHLNLSSFCFCIASKMFLNRDSLIYLKLDAGLDEAKKLRTFGIEAIIKRLTISMADIVTAETSSVVAELKKIDEKVCLLPNGYAIQDSFASAKEKLNRFIVVGRLSSDVKNVRLVIEAFARIYRSNTWNLRLVGEYDDLLYMHIVELCGKYDGLQERIELVGEITDRNQLLNEYSLSKVLLFPSKSESFGFVLLEALATGNYIVSANNIPAAKDIIYDSKVGTIVDDYKVDSWALTMQNVTEACIDYDYICNEGYKYVDDSFSWKMISNRLSELLKMKGYV